MDSELRLTRGFWTQVIYMLFLPFFFFLFCLLYNPAGIKEYYSFGRFSDGFHIVMLSCIILVCLCLLRTAFYFIAKHKTLRWWQYALWCLGEVFVISCFLALYTVLFRHDGSPYFQVLSTCFCFAAMTLVFPYGFLVMTQVIRNKNEDLLRKEQGGDDSLVRFYDEHKRLKLSVAPSSVLYVKSDFNYVNIHYLSGDRVKDYTLRCSMKSLAESASASQALVRCQRSYFVNPRHVKVLWKDKEGFIYADLDVPDLPSIPVSKQYYDTIAALL